MSKKNSSPLTLGFADIVLGADAETIRQALEARTQIDELLAERAQAYERIAALESSVEEILGDEASFPFPEPPLPVFGFGPGAPAKKKVAKKALPPARPAPPPAPPAASPVSLPKPADNTPAD
ncbi:MAG: hypothetical protein JJT96_19375 [Opitutales bacterium]|nr:hypothetical protein [Opitutales bacterium]